MAKFNENAQLVWRRRFRKNELYGGTGTDVAVTEDGYYVTGFGMEFVEENLFAHGTVLLKLNRDGEPEWGRFWGYVEDGQGALETNPNFAGRSSVVVNGNTVTVASTFTVSRRGAFSPVEVSYGVLLRFDDSGNFLDAQKFGGEADDGWFDAAVNPDGSLLITGYTESKANVDSSWGRSLWLLHLPANGTVNVNDPFDPCYAQSMLLAGDSWRVTSWGEVNDVDSTPMRVLTALEAEPVHLEAHDVQGSERRYCSFGSETPGPIELGPPGVLPYGTLHSPPDAPAEVIHRPAGPSVMHVRLLVPETHIGRPLMRYWMVCNREAGWCSDIMSLGQATASGDEMSFPLIESPLDTAALAGSCWDVYVGAASSSDFADLVYGWYRVCLDR
ncbi:hypothetical protein [Thermosulfurimonas sp. F29]|uniref:hypothetical protein n=1 Tax=Thermosulfurimonas sp. F29 TaxID=2867247 RepID=UPI001C836B9E|nr:hypothetical protein [Thermosulfurimonas sp. F29]MBX6423414.1 hypothetical protein [Thermosulfurimonas sp. F29]